jgi:hypothetical protein
MSSETENEGTDFMKASPDNAVEQGVPATPAAEQDSEAEELVPLSPNNTHACNRCYKAHRKVCLCLNAD